MSSEIKPLLALAAERGAAHGVLTGPGADYVRGRFDATTPIEIHVATLHALPQPGCARLEVTTRQRDVLEQGKRTDQELRWRELLPGRQFSGEAVDACEAFDDLQDRAIRRGAAGHGRGASNRPVVGARRERRHEGDRR